MNNFVINNEYSTAEIEKANESGRVVQHGDGCIGSDFMVLQDGQGNNVSFVLTSANVKSFYYKCIYTDFKQ